MWGIVFNFGTKFCKSSFNNLFSYPAANIAKRDYATLPLGSLIDKIDNANSSIELNSMSITSNDMRIIAEIIADNQKNKKYKFVDFANNDIGPEGMSYLSEALLNSTNIKAINVSYNNIGKEGFDSLAYLLNNSKIMVVVCSDSNQEIHEYFKKQIIRKDVSMIFAKEELPEMKIQKLNSYANAIIRKIDRNEKFDHDSKKKINVSMIFANGDFDVRMRDFYTDDSIMLGEVAITEISENPEM